MKDRAKTKQMLIGELDSLRERIAALEKSELERKHAEEAFRESEEKYRTLFENAGEAILVAQDARVVFFNPMTITITGYSGEEIAAKPFIDFIHADDRDMIVDRHIRRLRGEDVPRSYDFRVLHKNGSFLWIQLDTILISWQGKPATLNFMTNITDRKQAEEELRASEEKYRLIFEYSPLGLLSFDEKGVIVACNNKFVKIIGSSRERLIGLNMLKLPNEKVLLAVKNALKGSPGFYEGDYSSVTAKKITPVRCLFAPMDLGGGRISGGVGIIEDITKRKQAEESVRRSEEKYRTIIEEMVDGYFEVDLVGNYTFVNEAESKIIGYSRDELIGMNNRRYQDEKNAKKSYEAFRRIYKTGEPVKSLEIEIIRKDKTIGFNEISVSLKKDHEGKPTGFQGFTRDITDRKRSMNQLRKALGGTVKAIASVVESKDPYTAGHQHRVADISRAIATEMGLSHDQIEGVRMAGIIHDIGKVSVPSEILSMPRKLTDLEFSLIQTHAQSGYDILKDIEFPWPIARMVLEHHERMNGSGYPNGLRGDDILPESRILAVADVVEAMATYRPYRAALGLDAALVEIAKNRGILYDPDAVDACLHLFHEKGFEIKG